MLHQIKAPQFYTDLGLQKTLLNPPVNGKTQGLFKALLLLNLSSWCLVMVKRLFLAVPQGCLRFVIVVFPDHTHLLFLSVFQVLFKANLIFKDFSRQVLFKPVQTL